MAGKGPYSAGTAFLTVVPSMLGVEKDFREQVRKMAAAADKDLAAAVNRGLKQASAGAKNTGAKAGKDFGGAYEAAAKKSLQRAWEALPEPDPAKMGRKWDKSLAAVRQTLKELSQQRIGLDIDRPTFDRAIANARAELTKLRDSVTGPNKPVAFFNAETALKELEELRKFSRSAEQVAAEGGARAGSAFTARMSKVLADAASKIPPITLDAKSTDAERKIADVRDRILALQSRDIGIDIDASEAFAQLRAIQTQLEGLDRRTVRVDIRTNAHEASAGMADFIQQADAAGDATQRIGGRANFSLSRLEYLIALGASLGTAIIPAAAAAAGAIGLIGTAAISSAIGVGVFSLALGGVGDAVKALNGVQQEQVKNASASSDAYKRVASSADQVRQAQDALANTRRNVGEAAQDAARRVADAEKDVAAARRQTAQETRNAARAVADARDAVVDAEQDVAAARRQARIDVAEANRQVRDAQRDVTDAERDALQVRKDLTEAIDDARRSMEELDLQISRNDLDQQKAVTAQMRALEELNRLKSNPRSTEVQIRQAQDAYDEQTQLIKELQLDEKNLAADKAKYAKDGVEADQGVIDARRRIAEADQKVAAAREKLAREQAQRREAEYKSQERIQDAQERVADAQERVARAQEGQRDAEIRGQERIAAAQQQVADARRDQQRQAVDGQYAIQQATNSLTKAQESQAEAWTKVGGEGSAAMQKLNAEMAELSPAQQDFARFVFGLKDELAGLRASAAEPLLPKLETAITGLLKYLPGVERFVSKVASGMGDLAINAVEALEHPAWVRFFSYIDKSAVPSMETMFEVGSNLTEGLISLYLALTPINEQAGSGLVALSRDFAEWANRLENTRGYVTFMQYVQENGPRVVHFLGELGLLFIRLVEAAAPVGEVVLQTLTLVVDAINSLPDGALTALVLGIAAVSLGMTVLGGVMRVQKLGEQLSGIFGPGASRMVQQFALDTGRATEQTSRFGRATATVQGIAAAAGEKMQGYGQAIAAVPGRVTGAATANTTLTGGLTKVRDMASSTASVFTSRAGFTSAVSAGLARVQALDVAAGQTATAGLARFRTGVQEISNAANGPGGMVAGVSAAATQVSSLTRSAAGAGATMGTKFAGGALTAAKAVGGKLNTAVGGLAGLVGGPFSLALIGATTAFTVLSSASADYNAKISTLKATLGNLGQEYKDLAAQGKLGTSDAVKLLNDITGSNPEMRQAVINLNDIGVSIDQLGRAASGSQQDIDTVLTSLDEEIDLLEKKWKDQSNFLFNVWGDETMATSDRLEEMRQLREAVQEHSDEARKAAEVQKILNGEDERAAVITAIKNDATGRSVQIQSDMVSVYDQNAKRISELNALLTTFGTNEGTAAAKADAMRKAIEGQTGAVIKATDADEDFANQLIGLRDQINGAKEAGDKHATSLELNTTKLEANSATALRNRDALQRVAGAIREMYLQDIAAGKPIADVTKAHQNRINSLIREADKLGLAESETRELIKAYGDVDPKLQTVYETKNFEAVYDELKQLKFIQNALAQGWSVEKAREVWEAQKWDQGLLNRAPRKAEGGPITGPGTKTSDDVLLWGSDGEFMHRAKAVDYYGESFMHALNGLEIPKDMLPGFAGGGLIGAQPTAKPKEKLGLAGYALGGTVKVPMKVNVGDTKIMTLDEVIAAAAAGGSGALGGGGGGQGYRWQMQVLRKVFPGLDLYSGYRPGSMTASGNLSWHARDGGRAVDIPPRRDVFNWIHDTYGANTKELIWGGDPGRNIFRGEHHRFSETLLRQHGPYKGSPGPSPHIHWAFDGGGWLPPGVSQVVNNTGSPEPVLNQQQWNDISILARQARTAGGNTYQFEFRDTTLDAAQLRAIQDREAVLARDDRAR